MRALLLAAAALFSSPLAAQAPPPPKLLVTISVDQLSSDLFQEYRPQFAGGLSSIASGALFLNGSSNEVRSQSLGDLLKARWPNSRNVFISGDAAPDPIAGEALDQHWFWAGSRFEAHISKARVPEVVAKVNAAVAAGLAKERPSLDAPPFCQPSPGKKELARAAGDTAALAASPELDGDTLALAAGLVDEMRLGRGADPDLLTIDLAATKNVARSYGTRSEEMCLQVVELDREIGDFLSLLDARGIDYAVAFNGTAKAQVPIAFWRPGFKGASVGTPVGTIDMVPTLATLIGLPAPVGLPGRCLEGTPAFCPQR